MAEPTPAATSLLPEPGRTVAVARSRRFPRRHALLGLAVLAVAALVVGIVIANCGGEPSGPPRSSEVAGAARAFARAYAHQDATALNDLLTADVQRVSPTGVERGRAAVVAEYKRQFASAAFRTTGSANCASRPAGSGA